MKFKLIHSPLLIKGLKVTSIILIVNAILLEFGNFYVLSNGMNLPNFFQVIIFFSRSAMIIHFLEGIIGVIYGLFQGKNFIKSGVYIFFTGTISLAELLNLGDELKSEN